MITSDNEIPSIGVEEEFQIVDKESANLAIGYERIAACASAAVKMRIKEETYQCFVESTTDICPSIDAVFEQTRSLRATLATLAQQNDLAIISAGTHPWGRWHDYELPSTPRHTEIGHILQAAFRSRLFFGLHVHIGIQDKDLCIQVMNQARSYLPHILALSANSPFWMGQLTGWLAYRTQTWVPAPWVGIPEPFSSAEDYYRLRNLLFNSEMVRTFHLWWDIKPHDTYPTLEFRIADMPLHHADMVAIVALIQSLVKKLLWLNKQQRAQAVLPTILINENKWRAGRWGLRGSFRDWQRDSEVSTLDALNDMLAFVHDVADELGTAPYLAHIQSMLEPDYRSGAEMQIQTFAQHQDLAAVAHMLIHETLKGVDVQPATVPL